jgi:hypothetical protein
MISLSLLLNETQRSGRIWDVARIYAHKNPTTKRGIIGTDAAYVSQLTSCLAGKANSYHTASLVGARRILVSSLHKITVGKKPKFGILPRSA